MQQTTLEEPIQNFPWFSTLYKVGRGGGGGGIFQKISLLCAGTQKLQVNSSWIPVYILHHGPTKAFSKIVPLKRFRFEGDFFSISNSISYTYSLVNSSNAEFAGRFQFLIDIVRVVQLTERWCCFAGNLFLEDKNICSFVKVRIRNGGVIIQ